MRSVLQFRNNGRRDQRRSGRALSSTLSGYRPRPILAGIGAALVLAVGLLISFQVAYADRVYPGVRALGIELGGYSRAEASALLQRAVDETLQRRYTLQYGEYNWALTARELGVRTDVGPVLSAVFAVGREGSFIERLLTPFGLWRIARPIDQLSAAFDAAVQLDIIRRIEREVNRPVQNPTLAIRSDYAVSLQPAITGRTVDVEGSLQRLREALSSGSEQVQLKVVETAPLGTGQNLAPAREQAERILSDGVTLIWKERKWVLDRAQLASILRFDLRDEAKSAAYLDRPALAAWSKSLAAQLEQTPEEARFNWAGGQLELLRSSRDGQKAEPTEIADAIDAAANGSERVITVPVRVTRPKVSSEDRDRLGIKELVESSRTTFAGSVEAKRNNISLAARRLNGAVVAPGATFSFNREVGPTTLDAGFQVGFGITSAGSGNVKTVPSVAGGICQVSTTLFHSVFWAGYTIEERNIHLYWIPAYTSKGHVGLDSTVDEEAGLDFRFTNPTNDHILIQSYVDESQNLNFALYGTRPGWKVSVEESKLTDLVEADRANTVTEEEQNMPLGQRLQVERATDGFTVTNLRRVVSGTDDRTLRLTSKYRPSRNVILVGTGGRPPSRTPTTEVNKPSAAATAITPTAGPSSVVLTPAATRAPIESGATVPTATPPRLPFGVPTPLPVIQPTPAPAKPGPTPQTAGPTPRPTSPPAPTATKKPS